MADRKIDEFATLPELKDDDLVLVSSETDTYNTKVSTLKGYVKEEADRAVEAATNAVGAANEAKEAALQASEDAEVATELATEAKNVADDAKMAAQAAQTASEGAQTFAQTAQTAATSARSSATQAANDAQAARESAQAANDTANEAYSAVEELKSAFDDVSIDKDDLGLEQDEETGLVYPTYKGERSINGIPLQGGSGGGGGSASSILKLRNLLPSTTFSVPYSDGCSCVLEYSFSSTYADGEDTGAGTVVYYVGGVAKYTETIEQGTITRDIGELLTPGKTNTVRVLVTDQDLNSKALVYNITVAQNYITSSFPILSKQMGSFQIAYTPVGSGDKTVYFEVDGEVVDSKLVTSSNRTQYQTIPALAHGKHVIKVYMSTLLEGYGDPVSSNTLIFGVVAIEDGNPAPILLLLGDILGEVSQYDMLEIPFIAYDPAASKGTVTGYFDDEQVTTLNVSSEATVWNYTVTEPGEHTLKLKFGELEESFAIDATEVSLVAKAETEGLKFYFSAANRSNNEPNPAQYSYTNEDGDTYNMTFNGIKFARDGWTGKSLDIGVGASVDIDYKPFATDITNTVGKTIEINLKVKSVYDYSSPVVSIFANDKGIHITPNDGSLAVNSSDQIDIKFNDNSDVRISFVISARDASEAGKNQLIFVYVNSDIAGVLKYGSNDTFSQLNAAGIHIGSEQAAVELYNIRCYEVALSSYAVLDNFIVDSPDPLTMLNRDRRNDIFDEQGEVDFEKLPPETPYLVISCPELPQYKGDKKKGVSGRFVDKANPAKSFTFTGAEFDVQGTSSAGYYIKNFKGKFSGGFTNNDGETSAKYAINSTDIPVSTFCFKADVASSEGANNVVLMELWEKTTPYKTPPQLQDSRVRQTIGSRPIVVFWENSDTGEVLFWGKYNFNNDKGTADTFGFVDNDEHTCQSWEFKDNGLALTEFRTGDFTNWQTAFEARFPDKFTDTTKLQRVVSWVASTDTTAATDESLGRTVTYEGVGYTNDTAEYRLAKFKAEFEDYFVKDNVLYYYLFTDLFLMVDSRAKNQFLTTWDGVHWLFLPYDGDTALGINNIGALKFDYYLEDTDTVGGNDVYNGQQSVLWKNVRACFSEDIVNLMVNKIDASKLSLNAITRAFDEHQGAWSEAIICADTVVKYLNAYRSTGVLDYLNMALGLKTGHRNWWLPRRLAYEFARFHMASDIAFDKDHPNYIMFRMSEPADEAVKEIVPFDMTLKVTPYINTYVNVTYGGSASATDRVGLQSKKTLANQQQTFDSTLDSGRDSTVYVFGAESIKDIGDLSPMYPQIVNISAATNLEKLIIGNATEGYKNEALTELNIGNNAKLKIIDVRNCVALSGAITAGACDNLEAIYAEGTKVTSVSLPNTGMLKVLHLPSTITALVMSQQTSIEDLQIAGYDGLKTLYLDNCPSVDALDVIANAPNLESVYLANVDWTLTDTSVLDRLLMLNGINEGGVGTTQQSVITGRVHLPSINTSKLAAYRAAWPSLNIEYTSFIPQYAARFYDADGTLLYTQYVDRGGTVIEPIEAGYIPTPTKSSTVDKVFTFSGWGGINFDAPVAQDVNATAQYTEQTRQYTVQFAIEGEIVQTEVVDAYGSVAYTGSGFPRKADDEVGMTYYLFDGWDAEADSVTQDMLINAKFIACTPPAHIIDLDAFAEEAEAEGYTPFVATNFDEVYPEGKTGVTPRKGAYTLEEFYAICKCPLFKSYFRREDDTLRYGDMIEIWLDDNNKGTISDSRFTAWINAYNHFERADGTGLAHVSMDLVYCLNQTRRINSSNTNAGGWYDPANNRTELRNWLNNNLLKALPTKFQQMLSVVNITSSIGNGKNESYDITTAQDRLYLLSSTEIFGSTSAPYKWEVSENAEIPEGLSVARMPIYVDANNRIKRMGNEDGSTTSWWTRSPLPGSSTYFVFVSTGGSSSSYNAGNSFGVAFGFCIG